MVGRRCWPDSLGEGPGRWTALSFHTRELTWRPSLDLECALETSIRLVE